MRKYDTKHNTSNNICIFFKQIFNTAYATIQKEQTIRGSLMQGFYCPKGLRESESTHIFILKDIGHGYEYVFKDEYYAIKGEKKEYPKARYMRKEDFIDWERIDR